MWKPFSLAVSYVFYAAADVQLLPAAGRRDARPTRSVRRSWTGEHPTARRTAIVAATVTVDLVALGFFKYYGFFVSNVADLLDDLDSGAPLPLLTVALPVGLSFFTFQAISYVVDVRRGLCERATTDRPGDLPVVLPASGRGADRPRARVPAAARHAARPARRRRRRGRDC